MTHEDIKEMMAMASLTPFDAIMKAYDYGVKEAEINRRQGEWVLLSENDIRAKEGGEWRICSSCKSGVRFVDEKHPYSICPWCGAMMRKGAKI